MKEIELINKDELFNLALLCRCIADAVREFLGLTPIKMSKKTDQALEKSERIITKLLEGALLVESKSMHLPVAMKEPGSSVLSTSFIYPSVDGMAIYAFFLENKLNGQEGQEKGKLIPEGRTHSVYFWEILEFIKNREFTEEKKNRVIYLFESLANTMSNGILTLGIKDLERFF